MKALDTCIKHDLKTLAQNRPEKIFMMDDILRVLRANPNDYYVNYSYDDMIMRVRLLGILEQGGSGCPFDWLHGYALKKGAYSMQRRGRRQWDKRKLDQEYMHNLTF